MSTRNVVGVAQLGLGALLLARPDAVARAAAGHAAGSRSAPDAVVRLLGGRIALEGVVLVARRSELTRRGCAAVDVIHCASMLWPAVALPQYRRSAVVSGLVAAGFGTASLLSRP